MVANATNADDFFESKTRPTFVAHCYECHGGEFGRTPYAQVDKSKDKKKAGRDHHHTGFSMFLAGGGIRGGFTHGSTDDFGMHAVEDRVHVHDLHATVLHQMGINHKKLTFRYSGRDYRLTDVHGRVVHNLIA